MDATASTKKQVLLIIMKCWVIANLVYTMFNVFLLAWTYLNIVKFNFSYKCPGVWMMSSKLWLYSLIPEGISGLIPLVIFIIARDRIFVALSLLSMAGPLVVFNLFFRLMEMV